MLSRLSVSICDRLRRIHEEDEATLPVRFCIVSQWQEFELHLKPPQAGPRAPRPDQRSIESRQFARLSEGRDARAKTLPLARTTKNKKRPEQRHAPTPESRKNAAERERYAKHGRKHVAAR